MQTLRLEGQTVKIGDDHYLVMWLTLAVTP